MRCEKKFRRFLFVCLPESKVDDVICALPCPQGLLVPIGHYVLPNQCSVSLEAKSQGNGGRGGGGGGGRGTPNSSDGDDRRIFGGLKFSIQDYFG